MHGFRHSAGHPAGSACRWPPCSCATAAGSPVPNRAFRPWLGATHVFGLPHTPRRRLGCARPSHPCLGSLPVKQSLAGRPSNPGSGASAVRTAEPAASGNAIRSFGTKCNRPSLLPPTMPASSRKRAGASWACICAGNAMARQAGKSFRMSSLVQDAPVPREGLADLSRFAVARDGLTKARRGILPRQGRFRKGAASRSRRRGGSLTHDRGR